MREGRGRKVEDRSDGAAQLLEGREEARTEGGHRLRFDRGRSRKEAVEQRAFKPNITETQTTHLI